MKLKTLAIVVATSSVTTFVSSQEQPKPAPPAKTPANVTVERIGEKIRAANGGSTQVTEIVKMSEAGVDEKTILGYIESLPATRINADDVIYMHEKKVAGTVITAMLQHYATAAAAAAQAQAAAAPAATQGTTAQASQPAVSTPVYIQQPEPTYVTSPSVVYTVPSYGYYGYPYYYGGYYPYYYGYRGCYPYYGYGYGRACYPSHYYGHSGFRVYPSGGYSGSSPYHVYGGGHSGSGFRVYGSGGSGGVRAVGYSSGGGGGRSMGFSGGGGGRGGGGRR